ncbi:MAG TPA: PecA family PE domain-processing aspartic protease [Mycobacterium sp.]|nr:PecA family PE domain-processing aspartic protease [Mycobacterium sp.]HUH69016.1 PecA family PE domain-processing aspartic protease [Mycobacterium sp.]
MSFLVSPPEIISSLLYAGAGSGPMLAASAAWDDLATELGSAAQSFSSVTSGLAAEAWHGPASAAMLSTAAQYSGVLSAAATQAQTAAAQAQTVASEFESALAATVHPALVVANRNQLVQLVVSNLFGQNAPAIAATESEYEQMWAQDVSAMVGYHGGVSAAAAQLSSWPTAVQGLPAQASAAIASSPVGSALSSLNSAASSPLGGVLGTIEHDFINVINAPTELLLGRQLIATGPQATGGSATVNGQTATAPLTIVDGTEPVVNASVGSGSAQPLLVDTGSAGLVIPFTDVGGLLGVLQLGIPRGFGLGGYSGGLDYLYATYNAPVNFGGGLVTSSTPVDVEFFAWPTSIQSAMNNGLTFQSFFASDGVTGVLGVGPNAGGPGPSIPTEALPAPYNQGLLINEVAASPYLQFGAAPTGLTPIATLTGSPITTLEVSVNGGAQQAVSSIVDSGGVEGTIPSSLNVAPGSVVSVYAPGDPTALYSYTYDGTYFPTAISSGLMNTGALPFLENPAYINYGADTTTFYEA